MRFEVVQELHASIDEIEEALVDPRFLDVLTELPKLGRPRLLEQRRDNDEVFQRVRYDFVGNLSATVKTVVDPAKLSWVEESTQDRRNHRTAIAIVPEYYGSLFECRGTITLDHDPGTGITVRTASGDVIVRVPFVASKAEAAIISGLHEHADLEAEALDDWIEAEKPHPSAS